MLDFASAAVYNEDTKEIVNGSIVAHEKQKAPSVVSSTDGAFCLLGMLRISAYRPWTGCQATC